MGKSKVEVTAEKEDVETREAVHVAMIADLESKCATYRAKSDSLREELDKRTLELGANEDAWRAKWAAREAEQDEQRKQRELAVEHEINAMTKRHDESRAALEASIAQLETRLKDETAARVQDSNVAVLAARVAELENEAENARIAEGEAADRASSD